MSVDIAGADRSRKWMEQELSANTALSSAVDCLHLQLMKATVLAESSYSIHFHRDLSAPAMSTDVSQVGVALLPSF